MRQLASHDIVDIFNIMQHRRHMTLVHATLVHATKNHRTVERVKLMREWVTYLKSVRQNVSTTK